MEIQSWTTRLWTSLFCLFVPSSKLGNRQEILMKYEHTPYMSMGSIMHFFMVLGSHIGNYLSFQ